MWREREKERSIVDKTKTEVIVDLFMNSPQVLLSQSSVSLLL